MKAPIENTPAAEHHEQHATAPIAQELEMPTDPVAIKPASERVELLQNSPRNERSSNEPGCYERQQGAGQSERITGASHTLPVCERGS